MRTRSSWWSTQRPPTAPGCGWTRSCWKSLFRSYGSAMAFMRNVSIKERLTAIIMAASTISVIITTITISIIGVYTMRQNLLSELVASASLVGDRNTAALLFNDDKLAASNMQVFAA